MEHTLTPFVQHFKDDIVQMFRLLPPCSPAPDYEKEFWIIDVHAIEGTVFDKLPQWGKTHVQAVCVELARGLQASAAKFPIWKLQELCDSNPRPMGKLKQLFEIIRSQGFAFAFGQSF